MIADKYPGAAPLPGVIDYMLRKVVLRLKYQEGGSTSPGAVGKCVKAKLVIKGHNTDSEKPGSTIIATAYGKSCELVGYKEVNFIFDSPPQLTENTIYWLKLSGVDGTVRWAITKAGSYSKTGFSSDSFEINTANPKPYTSKPGDFYFKAYQSEEICNSSNQCVD
jgi:hypothetical protein